MSYVCETIQIHHILKIIRDGVFQTKDSLWAYDAATGDFCFDETFYDKTGYSKDSVKSLKDFLVMISAREAKELEMKLEALFTGKLDKVHMSFRIRCADQSSKMYMIKASLINRNADDDKGEHRKLAAGSIVDLDEKRMYEYEINHLAYYDTLTQLPNSALFHFKAASVLTKQLHENRQGALICINIDNFKSINSLYGRHIGNEVLCSSADIIKANLAACDVAARLGGDVFLLYLDNAGDRRLVEKKIKKILNALKPHFTVKGNEIGITCSAGIAQYPRDGDTIEELLVNAEVGMYQAKQEGRNTYRFFNNAMRDRLNNDREMGKRLKSALLGNEFHVVYQPQIDLYSGKIAGTEALLRWESKEYGNIPPSSFIPVAEATGIIYDIGNWVLEEVCFQCKQWNDEGMDVPVAVNISPVQIRNESFCDRVFSIIDKAAIPPGMLQIEITESSMVDNFAKASSILAYFKKKGIRIALDDFGTGYSSLTYIKQLPLDIIKIDRDYIKNLQEDKTEKAIAGSIIALAHVLGMEVIAEGIETKEQYEQLKRMGCNTGQGYYFSKPLQAGEMKNFFTKTLAVRNA